MKILLLNLFFSVSVFASDKVIPFEAWKDSPEKRVLNLFSGYRDDSASPAWSGPNSNQVVLYIKRVSATIARPAQQLDLGKLANLPDLQRIFAEFTRVDEIASDKIATNVNPKLSWHNPPNRKWCEGAGLCLELNFSLDMTTRAVLLALFPFNDPTIRAQSEVLVAHSQDLSQAQIADLMAVTEVHSPPTSVITQNIFWFNHAFEFAKVVAVVQPDPRNAAQSFVSGFAVFAVERKHWDRGYKVGLVDTRVSEILLGHILKRKTGLRMGMPDIVDSVFDHVNSLLQP